MTRNVAFTIFTVAVAVSAASAISIVPDIPLSRSQALDILNKGCNIGRESITKRINASVEAINDQDQSADAKQCLSQKAEEIQQATLKEINSTCTDLATNLQNASNWITTWLKIVAELPTLILSVVIGTINALEAAKADCNA